MIGVLNGFLRNSVASSIRNEGNVFAVMGNESADLDSMVSSLVYAFHLHLTLGKSAVPVFNLLREDFSLRTDAEWLFREAGVDISAVPHIDDVDLMELRSKGRLALTLVDHNLPSEAQNILKDCVVEVLDHHKDEGLFVEGRFGVQTVWIEPTGSAVTLVALRILEDEKSRGIKFEHGILGDYLIARLCLACILIDTLNLDSSKKKFLPKDKDMVQCLASVCGMKEDDLSKFTNDLLKRRTDVCSLSSSQIIRKDLKAGVSGGWRFAIASVPLSVEEWLKHDANFLKSLQDFADSQRFHLICSMNAFNDEKGEFRRELVLLVNSLECETSFFPKLLEEIQNANVFDLQKTDFEIPLNSIPAKFVVFNQGNSLASRKQVLPWISSILSKIQ